MPTRTFNFRIFTTLSLLFIAPSFAYSATNDIPKGYKLVWADEFSGKGYPDSRFWDYDTSGNRLKWYHNERQYYTSKRLENARVENGVLIIEARQEALSGLPGWVGQEFSSVRLITKGRKSFKYGFFEIRAKLPCAVGSWPAIWMLGETPNGRWPDDGEIDIMEQVGFKPNEIHGSIHTRYTKDRKFRLKGTTTVKDNCSSFHNYQVHWQKNSITFLVDGLPYYSVRNKVGTYEYWPFNHKFYLILNIAVGGAWGAQKGIKPEEFPVQMEVDYVRVYQSESR